MTRKAHPTDLTDEQWERVEPLLPKPKSGTARGGRPAADTGQVLDAISHLLRGGQGRRMLPHDSPPWQTGYTRFRLWRPAGVWDRVHATLRAAVRVAVGHPPAPETLRVDRQTVKTTHRGGPRGCDGGGKVNGRKRVIAADALGLVWALLVTPASDRHRDAGRWRLGAARGWLPRVREVIADRGFRKRFQEYVRRVCRWTVTITAKAADGFKGQPRRWVVGRTFGWFVRYRRLMADDEDHPGTGEAMIQAAMTHRMLRRLHPTR